MTGSDLRIRPWTVYLLRCANGALYTGITTDLPRRLAEHEGAGARGARALRGRGPLQVAYQASLPGRALASRVEHLIKRLPKRDKEALVSRQPRPPALLRALGLSGRG